MKKNRWMLRAAALVMLSALLMTTLSVAATVGSSKDPLITLSYLEEVFMDEVLDKVDEKIDQRNDELASQLGGGGDGFTVVTLSNGQTLVGDIGCEVMLRVGTAVCVSPSSPGLIDESAASTLNNGGALVTNHLYMMTIEDRGVLATSDTVKVLARGSYVIN
ncbi:MAG: hypothetical protein IJ396_04135 [Oscillibacter sp.]|nr:hypothetical protein [Oscillibacter sp.]